MPLTIFPQETPLLQRWLWVYADVKRIGYVSSKRTFFGLKLMRYGIDARGICCGLARNKGFTVNVTRPMSLSSISIGLFSDSHSDVNRQPYLGKLNSYHCFFFMPFPCTCVFIIEVSSSFRVLQAVIYHLELQARVICLPIVADNSSPLLVGVLAGLHCCHHVVFI